MVKSKPQKGAGELDDPALRIAIGKKIKQLRQMQDVSQVALAKAIGMTSTGAISQVENGTKGLKMTSLLKAARFFGVHYAILLDTGDYSDEELRAVQEFMLFLKAKHNPDGSLDPSVSGVRALMRSMLGQQAAEK